MCESLGLSPRATKKTKTKNQVTHTILPKAPILEFYVDFVIQDQGTANNGSRSKTSPLSAFVWPMS
jgi:hypothetical protein